MTRSLKTSAVLAATAAVALMLSTSALAAFRGNTAPTSGWSVMLGPRAGAQLAPGGATVILPFTVVNDGQAVRVLRAVAASIPAEPNGDAETATGADIPGCRASWLSATVAAASGPAVAPGSPYTGEVTLRMLDSGTNQDACQRAEPAVRMRIG